ncbi:MAG: hypothetical protein HOI96_08340 [Rhodospirillaceae bacterium]|nr:hypothetical protein [Rhodospirillaceae bacterium]
MKKYATSALVGAAFLLPLSLSINSPALANSDEINQCAGHVAELERSVARKTKGDQRREILRVLGAAKAACIKGNIAVAYQGCRQGAGHGEKARELRLSPDGMNGRGAAPMIRFPRPVPVMPVCAPRGSAAKP